MASEDVQRKVLRAVEDYWLKYYISPSRREIVERTGVNSTSVISEALDELESAGLLHKSGIKGTARSYVPMWVVEAIKPYS